MSASYANTLVAVASNLVAIPLYVRFLPRADYGLLLAVTGLTGYLGLLNLGLPLATSTRVADALYRGDPSTASSVLATGFWAYVRIVLVALAAMAVVMRLLPLGALFKHHGSPVDLALFVFVALSVFLVEQPFTVFSACLRTTGFISVQQNLLSVQLLVRLVAAAVALAFGVGVLGVVVVLGAVNLMVRMVEWRALRRRLPALSANWSLRNPVRRRELRHPSAYYFLLQFASAVGFSSDPLVISSALGTAAVAPYLITQRLANMVASVSSTLASIFGPRFIAANAEGLAALRRDFDRALRMSVALGAGSILVTAGLGMSFLRLWVGDGNYVGRATFAAIMAVFAIQVVLYPFDTLLVVLGRHRRYAIGTMLEAALNLLLSLLLIRPLGILGPALGTLLARSAMVGPVLVLDVSRLLGSESLKRSMLGTATLTLPAIAVAGSLLLLARPHPAGPVSLAVWGLGVAVSYAITVALCLRLQSARART